MEQEFEQFVDLIKVLDERSREARARRMKFINDELPKGHLILTGGEYTIHALEEAKWCFVNGFYIATVLLSQIVLEYILGGIFRLAGRDDLEKARFSNILSEALKEGFISEEEFRSLTKIPKVRNPYSHYRTTVDKESISMRRLEEGKQPEEIFYNDAKMVLSTVFRLLKRRPFFYPEENTPERADS